MSYKWTSGSVRRGDIYAQEDTTGDATYIEWGQDTITFRPGDDATMFLEEGRVGIGTVSPACTLHVSGAAAEPVLVRLDGNQEAGQGYRIDVDTDGGPRLQMGTIADDDKYLEIGGWDYNNRIDSKNRNLQIYSDADTELYMDAATGHFAIGDSFERTSGLALSGTFSVSGSDSDLLFAIRSDSNVDLLAVSGSGKIGFGAPAPDVAWADFEFGGPVFIDSNMLFMSNDKGMKWGDGSVSILGNASDETLTVKADSNTYFFLDGNAGADGFGTIGVGTSTPAATLHISGSDEVSLFAIRSDTNIDLFTVTGSGQVGIGTPDPKIALDVHDDPTSLENDTGGGTVVKFGTDASLTAGKVYYFHTNGVWTETDADAVGTGADQLLGISLGTDATIDGILIQGFFDATTYLSNFSTGKAVYLSTTAASMDTIAPAGTGDFVRVVGMVYRYCKCYLF